MEATFIKTVDHSFLAPEMYGGQFRLYRLDPPLTAKVCDPYADSLAEVFRDATFDHVLVMTVKVGEAPRDQGTHVMGCDEHGARLSLSPLAILNGERDHEKALAMLGYTAG